MPDVTAYGPGSAEPSFEAETLPLRAVSDDEIYRRFVDALLDHRLAPGTKLIEDQLAQAFGVPRTRIRPVLARLAGEQLVTLTPNRGARVARPDAAEAREVFEARRLIEPRLLELFMEKSPTRCLADLTACIDAEEAARERGDRQSAIRLSGDFHLSIARATGHETLARILSALVSRTSLVLMAWGPPQHVPAAGCGCHAHRALLDAMRLGARAQALNLMREHLDEIEGSLHFCDVSEKPVRLRELFRPR